VTASADIYVVVQVWKDMDRVIRYLATHVMRLTIRTLSSPLSNLLSDKNRQKIPWGSHRHAFHERRHVYTLEHN
jgi:hypothetical protein